ncbi:hypothetical protein AVEN_48545-1 [Araneus ventricosus]|uniref:Uncharacterized protein n=1 Tax=Araneus ventricosus TaxID=182803 RepID=A0A4Y2NU71_ARAVE|nr:hypothetical protein AVEN_48545-1 [Araneus ventricosus]
MITFQKKEGAVLDFSLGAILRRYATVLEYLDHSLGFYPILHNDACRGSLVGRSRLWGRRVPCSKLESIEAPPFMGPVARQIIRSDQKSSRWCGVQKIPTLAPPNQEGCKVGSGAAGREPLQQHAEDGIYWVQ